MDVRINKKARSFRIKTSLKVHSASKEGKCSIFNTFTVIIFLIIIR